MGEILTKTFDLYLFVHHSQMSASVLLHNLEQLKKVMVEAVCFLTLCTILFFLMSVTRIIAVDVCSVGAVHCLPTSVFLFSTFFYKTKS